MGGQWGDHGVLQVGPHSLDKGDFSDQIFMDKVQDQRTLWKTERQVAAPNPPAPFLLVEQPPQSCAPQQRDG